VVDTLASQAGRLRSIRVARKRENKVFAAFPSSHLALMEVRNTLHAFFRTVATFTTQK